MTKKIEEELESLDGEISTYITRLKKENGEKWVLSFLNNFSMKIEEAISPSNFWKKRRELQEPSNYPNLAGKAQTIGDFHKVYRRALKDSGMSIPQFRRRYKTHKDLFKPESLRERARTGNIRQDLSLFVDLLPAYVLMRKEGYSHDKITGGYLS